MFDLRGSACLRAVVLLLFAPGIAFAQPCADYSRHPALVGSLETPGSSEAFELRGGYAYVADGLAGVQVIDVGSAGAPRVVGNALNGTFIRGLAVGEQYLFAEGLSGIWIIDISTPTLPVIVGTMQSYDVFATTGSFLLGGDESQLYVVDVRNPNQPTTIGSLTLTGRVAHIVVSGFHVVVGVSRPQAPHALHVIDFSDPSSPELLSTVDLDVYARALSADGPYVFVAAWFDGLRVVDLTDPTSPSLHQGPSAPRFAHFVAHGSWGYGVGPGLWIYDLSDPTSARLVGNAYVPGPSSTWGSTYEVAASGTHVYVVRSTDDLHHHGVLSVFDVEDPASHIESIEVADFAQVLAFVQRQGYAYVGADSTLQVYDVSAPDAPRRLAIVPTSSLITALDFRGGLLAAGTAGEGDFKLMLYDVADAASPVELGSVAINLQDWSGALDVLLTDTHAYVSSYEEFAVAWLTVVDITDPAAPRVVRRDYLDFVGGFEGTAWSGPRLARSGNHLFITRYRGFGVYELSDPVWPAEVASYGRPWHLASEIEVSGDRLYLTMNARSEWYAPPPEAERRPGLHVFDISEPPAPEEIAFVGTPDEADQLFLASDFAYVRVATAGIHAIDIGDPSQPFVNGYWMTPEDGDFAIVGNSVYAFSREAPHLRITGVPCEAEVPVYLASFTAERSNDVVRLLWEVTGEVASADFKLVGRQGSGRWDVPFSRIAKGKYEGTDTRPAVLPRETVYYDLYAMELDEAAAWLLLGTRAIHPSSAPRITRLLAPRPNPFNPGTVLRFEVATRERVSLGLFDTRGRKIRTLVSAVLNPGPHQTPWDGRDDRGSRVPSGVYLARLATPTASSTARLVLLK